MPETGLTIDPRWGYALLCVLGGALLLALAVGAYVLTRIRRINLPPEAGALEALRLTPLSVVVLLDLLDLGLDFLSAPVGWIILTRLGLGPLRGVTIIESLIPGTQFIPTMTLAWLFARYLDPNREQRRAPVLPR